MFRKLAFSIALTLVGSLCLQSPSSAQGYPPLIRRLAMEFETSFGLQFLHKTREGREFARRLIGQPVRTLDDHGRILDALRRQPNAEQVQEELLSRFIRARGALGADKGNLKLLKQLSTRYLRLDSRGDTIQFTAPKATRLAKVREAFFSAGRAGQSPADRAPFRLSQMSSDWRFQHVMNETREGRSLMSLVLRRPTGRQADLADFISALEHPEQRGLLMEFEYRMARLLGAADQNTHLDHLKNLTTRLLRAERAPDYLFHEIRFIDEAAHASGTVSWENPILRQIARELKGPIGHLILTETPEGKRLARRLIGRPARTEADQIRLIESLNAQPRARFIQEELLIRLRRIRGAVGENSLDSVRGASLRRLTARYLRIRPRSLSSLGRQREIEFVAPDASGLALARDAFLGTSARKELPSVRAFERLTHHFRHDWRVPYIMIESSQGQNLMALVLGKPIARSSDPISEFLLTLHQPENRHLLLELDYRMGRIIDGMSGVHPSVGLQRYKEALLELAPALRASRVRHGNLDDIRFAQMEDLPRPRRDGSNYWNNTEPRPDGDYWVAD